MVDPSVADAVVKSAVSAVGDDPFTTGIKWFAAVVVVAVVAFAPLMSYVRKWREDSASNARDSAAAALYAQLKEQLRQNGDDIRELVKEKNHWFEMATKLSARVDQLEKTEERLEAKERENRQLLAELQVLTERIHQLELKLASGSGHCDGCIHGTKTLRIQQPGRPNGQVV